MLPGIKFRVTTPSSDVFMRTSSSTADEFCIVGGFWVRGGDFDENDNQPLPYAFATAWQSSSPSQWAAIATASFHNVKQHNLSKRH